MMKQGFVLLACLCSVFFLILFIAVQTSYGTEDQEQETAVVMADGFDAQQIQKEVAHAQTLGVPKLTAYFRDISKQKGAAYAYEILRRLPPSDLDPYKHLFGHVIGDELYNQQNMEGLELCTSEFSFACFHSVIAKAIDEQGLENIGEINKKCRELDEPGRCQHGIGHGIMASVGYDDPVTAVEVCGGLREYGVIRACIEGVIMEFNFRQVEELSPSAHRTVDEGGYYYPCTQLPDAYKNECYFEQTLWWREVLGRDNFSAIGALCDTVETEGSQDWCYRGIGRLIPEFSSDTVETMAAQCIDSTSVVRGEALCLQMLKEKTQNNGSVCSSLQGEYEDLCRLPVPALVSK